MSCGQGQLRVREAPITVSRRKLPAWDGRVTAFTEQPRLRARLSARDGWSAGEGPLLHSHLCRQTIKHLRAALTRAEASTRTFPARPRARAWVAGTGGPRTPANFKQAQSPQPGSCLGAEAMTGSAVSFSGPQFLMWGVGCNGGCNLEVPHKAAMDMR